MESRSSQTEQIIKKMTSEVIQDIGKQIEDQIIGLPEKKGDVQKILEGKMNKKKKVVDVDSRAQKLDLSTIGTLKQSKIVELKQIERHESILKRSQVSGSKVSHSVSRLEMSRFTEDQVSKIKEILRKQKKFEKKITEKEKNFDNWLEEKRLEDEQLNKKEIAEKCEVRKKEIKLQRKELQKKRRQRKVQHQEEMQKLKEIKAKKCLHQKMLEQSSLFNQTNLAQKMKHYEEEKDRRKLAFLNIQNHDKEYMQKKRQLDQKRSKQVADKLKDSKAQQPFMHSKFFQNVKREQIEKQKLQQYQRFSKQNNMSKQKLFSKQVKELFLPRINSKSKLVIKQQPKGRNPLKLDEQQQKGNQYMKSAHQHVTKSQIQKDKKTLEIQSQNGGYSAFYKNYLAQIKSSHDHASEKISSLTVKGLLQDPNVSEQKKLKKALNLIERRDHSYQKGNKNAELVDSIKSKMLVLNQLIR